jgi:hypothetical protein
MGKWHVSLKQLNSQGREQQNCSLTFYREDKMKDKQILIWQSKSFFAGGFSNMTLPLNTSVD